MNATRHAFRIPRGLTNAIRIICISGLLATSFVYITQPEQARADQEEFQQALDRINTYRSWIGIGPLQMNDSLMAAAQSHADYYALNDGNMPGLHNQTPGAPGFTGATMSDRASNFGYEGSINENIGLSGSMLSTVDWSIATINHRLTLIDPRYTDIGFGAVSTESGGMETIKLGTRNWSHSVEPEWQAWPVDGTTNTGLQYLGSAPSPFSGVPYPVGYPVTLKYHGPGNVQFTSAELQANGSSVPILAETGDGWLTRNTMMILAVDPLQPNTTYNVAVQATVDGAPVSHAWSFQTGDSNAARPQHPSGPADGGAGSQQVPPDEEPGEPSNPETTLPDGVEDLNQAFQHVWASADEPVTNGSADRTWLWGPDTFRFAHEHYVDSPGGERAVAYFDKSRMEINDPGGDPSSDWYVTNGLLVRDMISGSIHVGDNEFQDHEPAQIAVAGDDLEDNPDAPTYASFFEHSIANDDHREPDRTGEPVSTYLAANGVVDHIDTPPADVMYSYYDETTGFNVANVFFDWISSAEHYEWIYAVGHPITDPYWIFTSVDGEPQWVLAQAFQRRLLTFTPGNDPGWQLEMGNVGRHYYEWRYGESPPGY